MDLGLFSNSRLLIGPEKSSPLIGWIFRKLYPDSSRVGLREVESGTVPRTPTNTKPNISRDKFASLAARYSDDSEDIGGDRGKKIFGESIFGESIFGESIITQKSFSRSCSQKGLTNQKAENVL